MSNVLDKQLFQEMYKGKPPWDIGKPQSVFVEAADQIDGSDLDAGCGSAENALFFAARGWGLFQRQGTAGRRPATRLAPGTPRRLLQWLAGRIDPRGQHARGFGEGGIVTNAHAKTRFAIDDTRRRAGRPAW
jgi:hypothetical protein